jgi:hypothetical protein
MTSTSLFRMMSVYTDGGVSTRSLGDDREKAIDAYNIAVYGKKREELLFCCLTELNWQKAPLERNVIQSWARDHRDALDRAIDNLLYQRMDAMTNDKAKATA